MRKSEGNGKVSKALLERSMAMKAVARVMLGVALVAVMGNAGLSGPTDISLVYQGAFRGNIPWSGQTGLAYDPQGDTGSGSFFVHDAGNGPDMGEFSKAAPIIGAADPSGLNVATTLQHVLKPGWEINLGPEGMEILSAFGTQTSRKLYATRDSSIVCSYTETDGTDATGGNGPWSVSSSDSRVFGEGLSEVPSDWIADHLPTSAHRLLACGGSAWRSRGPSILAFRPTATDGSPEPSGTNLPSVELVRYSSTNNIGASSDAQWKSVGWIDNGQDQAVLAGGLNWIGGAGDVVPVILFYDPETLAQVADGALDKDLPQPVLEMDMTPYFFDDTDAVYGMDFDPAEQTLYVMEKWSESAARPIVHVFKVPSPVIAEPAGLSLLGLALLGLRKKRS
jgi:hypothetical protein